MYKACIFDLDGTLANTLNSIASFANLALEFNGYDPIDVNEYKNFIGNGADKLIERMLVFSKSNFTKDEHSKLRQKYDEFYKADPLSLVVAYDGIKELLKKLNESNIYICVLSNKPDNMTKTVVKELFSDIKFFEVIGQSENFPKKPEPDAVNYLVNKLNLKHSDVLYVGDSGVDMQTAKNAKLNSAGVLWGFRDEKELRENNATYIINNATELQELILS